MESFQGIDSQTILSWLADERGSPKGSNIPCEVTISTVDECDSVGRVSRRVEEGCVYDQRARGRIHDPGLLLIPFQHISGLGNV